MGLSPRGRGNRRQIVRVLAPVRSIPAWAGEPCRVLRIIVQVQVYPRVGGGTVLTTVQESAQEGLSPRGRGNQEGNMSETGNERSIPAWAGEPCRTTGRSSYCEVYPRVGGGTSGRWSRRPLMKGLSPRGRGNLQGNAEKGSRARSIPAWAGEPTRPSRPVAISRVYPRVGGGTPSLAGRGSQAYGLSPRGRGNPRSKT